MMKKKLEYIKDYAKEIDVSLVRKSIRSNNLRLFSNAIEAFLYTTNLFDLSELKIDNFMDSLLSSILFVFFCNNGKLFRLGNIKTGSKKIGQILNYRNEVLFLEKSRWLGLDISAYWIFNLPPLDDIGKKEILSSWVEYKYNDIEENLVKGKYDAFEQFEFNYDHLNYLLDKLSCSQELKGIPWRDYLEILIERTDLQDIQELKKILEIIECHLSVNICSVDCKIEIYQELAEKRNWTKASEESYYFQSYNEYIDKHGNLS